MRLGGLIGYQIGSHAFADRMLPPCAFQFQHIIFFQVQCFPTYSVLAALGNPTVDYFSLDVEGAEFPILKTIPWDKMTVKLLGIEIAHLGKVFEGTWQDVSKYLFNEDFIMIAQSTNDMFYEYSP